MDYRTASAPDLTTIFRDLSLRIADQYSAAGLNIEDAKDDGFRAGHAAPLSRVATLLRLRDARGKVATGSGGFVKAQRAACGAVA